MGYAKGSGIVTELSFLKSTTMRIPLFFFLTGMGGLDHAEVEGSMMSNSINDSSSMSQWNNIRRCPQRSGGCQNDCVLDCCSLSWHITEDIWKAIKSLS